ncbi:NAD+ diphosphatase [Andreprevotia lacus DSM 23236]|jgi:NAD+ diphosphatase|uniref:NAD-capped RNA hydrolase NudC n=1 Tax=Andreprevotia lacus DSM 23236 TaxID=1121001 RepID=A0A1W1XUH1_9NEIS|nr:NAD(+) diphosphatase [Andreprevotia lacus]SMC27505.1 NAD+ diphosphatase [Andreprevotia lacus DSM 23236]
MSTFLPLFTAPDAAATAHVFALLGEELLLTAGHRLPEWAALAAMPAAELDATIGELAGTPCRLLAWPAGTAVPEGVQALSLRAAHGLLDDALFAVAIRAKQLVHWDRDHRFCGRCGTATRLLPGEMAKVCPACEHRMYPRISPAMMVLIRHGNRLLLGRSPQFRPGVYSALAGFVEPGESVEDCVHREVQEEVGLRITNLRWFQSQSWPFPHSLMLAFFADYVSGDIVPQPGEIEDAQWFSPDALPELPSRASIAWRLIQAALAEMAADSAS